MIDFLRRVPLLAQLPEEDLAQLVELTDTVELQPGEVLFDEGARGDRAYIIQSGEVEIIKVSGSRPILLAVRKAGDVIGEIALLEDTPRTATVRARTPTTMITIQQEQFENLLNASPTASRVMLNTALARWRTTSVMLQQSEKMAQLGTLVAGIAHELNNPAAAVQSAVSQLHKALTDFSQQQSCVDLLALDAQQKANLARLADQTRASATQPAPYLDALTRGDREDELEDWLADHDVPNAWELAPTLVDLGYETHTLSSMVTQFSPEQMSAVVAWLGAMYSVHSLLAEVGQGAQRLSEIVKALKSYSYLDQAPIQQVNIHDGINDTLLILRSKLSGVRVQRDYAPDLPMIEGYGSELNQVWTNLIDNAADALEGVPNPAIVIRTSANSEWVTVEVEDCGPGIPLDQQDRIFDSFYTTKPPGKGTGLGLHITYNIVVNKHRGNIVVHSQPGRTVMRVTLPMTLTEEGAASPVPTVAETSDEEMHSILEKTHTIAVVGISTRAERPEHYVPAYLQERGFRIVPVSPDLQEVLGERAYPDLASIAEPVDMVYVFGHSNELLSVVEHAIDIGAKSVWTHEGVVDERAADAAQSAGLEVVMDVCLWTTYSRLMEG